MTGNDLRTLSFYLVRFSGYPYRMSGPSPPLGPASVSPRLRQRATGVPSRPIGSLDRIEVHVHYNAWDVYRMEMAERGRRSHSADAPVIAPTLPFGVILYVLVYLVYAAFASIAWRDAMLTAGMWIFILWAVWRVLAPFLEARRQAESAISGPPVRFVFSSAGVEMKHLDVSMQIAWPGIRRVKETRFSFLIYPRQPSPYATAPDGSLIQILPWMKLYFTVPLHCFADAADLRLVRELIRKHVAPEAKWPG